MNLSGQGGSPPVITAPSIAYSALSVRSDNQLTLNSATATPVVWQTPNIIDATTYSVVNTSTFNIIRPGIYRFSAQMYLLSFVSGAVISLSLETGSTDIAQISSAGELAAGGSFLLLSTLIPTSVRIPAASVGSPAVVQMTGQQDGVGGTVFSPTNFSFLQIERVGDI